MKILILRSRFPGKSSKEAPSDYKSRATPTCLVTRCLELRVSWLGIATSWRNVKRLVISWLKNKIWKYCLSGVPWFQKGNCFVWRFLRFVRFPSHKSSVKMKVGMQYSRNDTDRWESGILGEKLVAVLLMSQKNSQMLARFLTFDMRRRLLTTLAMSRCLKTEY